MENLPSIDEVAALLPWSADLPESCRSRVNINDVNQEEDDEYELYF